MKFKMGNIAKVINSLSDERIAQKVIALPRTRNLAGVVMDALNTPEYYKALNIKYDLDLTMLDVYKLTLFAYYKNLEV